MTENYVRVSKFLGSHTITFNYIGSPDVTNKISVAAQLSTDLTSVFLFAVGGIRPHTYKHQPNTQH